MSLILPAAGYTSGMGRLTAILMLLAVGCTEPVVIAKPSDSSLQANVGSFVVVEGTAGLAKAGYYLKTSGPSILVDAPYGPNDWPGDGTRIRVTGILRASQDWPPFCLDGATWELNPYPHLAR
jgi:hypothetical protein